MGKGGRGRGGGQNADRVREGGGGSGNVKGKEGTGGTSLPQGESVMVRREW